MTGWPRSLFDDIARGDVVELGWYCIAGRWPDRTACFICGGGPVRQIAEQEWMCEACTSHWMQG